MRLIQRFNALSIVQAAKTPGLHCDGQGLYLAVGKPSKPDAAPTAVSWLLKYMIDGKAHEAGLGSYPAVSLGTARKIADAMREKVALHRHNLGADPIAEKREAKIAARVATAKAMTFRQAAEAYIDGRKAGWRNAAHRRQWTATLDTYAYPVFGDLPVSAVDTRLVTKVLEQPKDGSTLWAANPDMASRLRGRMEAILDWAKVRGHRTGENPARWKGHLAQALPKPAKNTKHHAAIAIDGLPAFMAGLRAQGGTAARCLEFTILTGVRTSEAIGATFGEFDLEAKAWTVPAERMKGGRRAHRVPLSADALAIVKAMRAKAGDKPAPAAFLFPGGKDGQPLSNMAMKAVLRRMDRAEITVHGFRSTLVDWASEHTSFPTEVREMALAHAVPNSVRAAYERTDLFDRRRAMADAWAAFCGGKVPAGASDLDKARRARRAKAA